VVGDGGFQMTLSELQLINHHKLPVKILLLNNDGYQAISSMQDNLFPGNRIGCSADSGVSNPNFEKLAAV
jgi:acetolactate synthase-1/2/3 large subunit